MLSLPFKVSDTEMDLFVILEDDNIERIKQYDPAEIVRSNLGPMARLTIRNVVIMYASKADIATVMPMFENGDPNQAMRHLSRGFRYRPDAGDHDDGYKSLLKRN
jgi:hypothetical protein